MITLRFVSHPGIFDRLCKFAQYGFWATHVDAVLPDGRFISARSADGVQIRPSNYDAGAFSNELRVDLQASEAQVTAFHAFLINQLFKPFDSLAIAAFAFGRDWQKPDAWFCDELLAAGLVACGKFPPHLALKLNRITVRDLFLLVSMTEAS